MATAALHSFCSSPNNTDLPSFNKQRNPLRTPPAAASLPKQQPRLSKQASTSQTTRRLSRVNQASIARVLFSYINAGRMDEALSLFQSISKPDTFLWNLIIRGYTNAELHQEAIKFYYRMMAAGVWTDNFTYPFIIKSSTSLLDYEEGLKIHGKLFKVGLNSNLYVCNALVTFYSMFGLIDNAESVFDEMTVRDIVTWNSMISSYVSNEKGHKALSCFKEMQEVSGMEYDSISIIAVLAACSLEQSWKKGKEVHCYVIKNVLESDLKLHTALLDMYCKCGKVTYAERLFHTMHLKNIVTWNALISGYVLNEQTQKAFTCMLKMQAESVHLDTITMVSILPACAELKNISTGKGLHGLAIRTGFLPHQVLETALIDMYAKCGELKPAEVLFNQMTEKSLVSWNTMITAYVQNDRSVKAIQLFTSLLCAPLKPDVFTISALIPAYADLTSLRHARQIHSFILRSEYGNNIVVLNAVVNMYARCGDLNASRSIFDRIVSRDMISWNTIIMTYGIHGQGKSALKLFSSMKRNGLQPNQSTFVSLLTACSKSGLVDEGWRHFNSMQQEYGMNPEIEHYGCMIDLLGRNGDLIEALDFINRMPLAPTVRIWGSLLTASRNKKNIEMAELAAKHILERKHDNTGCYVILSTMYAACGRWEDMKKIESLMKRKGLTRTPASSIVELNGKTCSFVNGDTSQDKCNTVNEVSDVLAKKIGERTCVLSSRINLKDAIAAKENLPTRHSARLAVVFGLITSKVGVPILVKKNIRICNYCHQAIKLISRFVKREIIVGDTKIYHHFANGTCCCGDYW